MSPAQGPLKVSKFVARAEQPTMTNEFIVVGEHKENNLELLVKGADGAYYEYDPVHEGLTPVQPDDNWVITESVDVDSPDLSPGVDASPDHI
jgi:hypothetical protein